MSLLVRVKKKFASYLGVKKWVSSLKRGLVLGILYNILGLKEVYTVGTKAKKEQQVFVKGGTGYIYKQSPEEKAAYDSQQPINTT